MRIGAILAAVLCLVVGASSASATVRISDDHGGRIVSYLYKFAMIRAAGERVVIDGTCASACTMVLGTVPRDHICVTSRAALGFHAAWQFGTQGRPVASQDGTRFLLTTYPPEVRHWISRHGGLTPHMMFLRGRELASMFPTCS